MREPRWPGDIPPPHAALYSLGQRCLDEVNQTARRCPPSTALERELLEIGRSQALAIAKLANELLRLRHEAIAASPVIDIADRRGSWWTAWLASVRRWIGPRRQPYEAAGALAGSERLRMMRSAWLLGRAHGRRSTPHGDRVVQHDDSGSGLLELARELVIHHRNGSTSWLQRTLRVSYEQALQLIYQLEEKGLVSSSDDLGRRAVLFNEAPNRAKHVP